MRKHSIKEKIRYWLETKLSKTPLEFIKIIAILTILLAFVIACLIRLFNSSEASFAASFWDTLASSINAWMPYSEDGNNNVFQIILTAIAAIFGLFVTSLLISIVSSSLEEKIEEIKKGNSIVIERNHIIILGFIEGEYTLIKELIKSAENKELTMVVASDKDKNLVEQLIKENVDCPDNVRIICRTIPSITPSSLECCSIDTCKSIIISPMDDENVVKYIYVLTHMLEKANRNDVVIVATIRNKEFLFPKDFNQGKNIIFLVLSDFVARIIARTCTQPGLSLAYLELFNNKGSELYTTNFPQLIGHSFGEAITSIDYGVPIGIICEDETYINPNSNYIIKNNDSLIVFSENKHSSIYTADNTFTRNIVSTKKYIKDVKKKILILGYNESFQTILDEVQSKTTEILLAGINDDNYKLVKKAIKRKNNYKLLSSDISIDDYDSLDKLTAGMDRVVLLNNHSKNGDSADLKVMLRLTKLREIRAKNGQDFTICVEFRRAANRTLVHKDDFTDYIVRTNMFSMFLSQLVSNPELKQTYDELLSDEGNEITILNCNDADFNNMNTCDIRRLLYERGYIYLGVIKTLNGKYNCIFNPRLTDNVNITDNDRLIVISR